MKVAYFTKDMPFAKRLSSLIGSLDEDIVFYIFECQGFESAAWDEKELKCNNIGKEDFDLVIAEEAVFSEVGADKSEFKEEIHGLEIGLLIKKEDKLLTLSEHYQNIVFAYRKKIGIETIDLYKGEAKIVYVCSAKGGCGKTTVALGLAQELVRFHDKKVLYLCLEPFASSEAYFDLQEKRKSIDEYLYYNFSQKEVNLFEFLRKSEYGVFSFAQVSGKNPIYELSSEELVKIIEYVNMQGNFDYIICDSYALLGEAEKSLISSAYKICLLERGEDDAKEEGFLNYIKKELYVPKEKLVQVMNFAALFESEKDGKISIPLDEQSIEKDGSGSISISLEKDFGIGIKKLCDEVM